MTLQQKIKILQPVRILLPLALLLAAVGCGSHSSLVVTPVTLPVSAEARLQGEDPVWEFLGQQGDAFLYRSKENGQSLFLTSLRACGAKNNGRKLRSTSRQLLVGFDQLSISSQEEVSFANLKALRSYATATIDKKTVAIAATTVITNTCSLDLVLWMQTSPEDETASDILKTSLTKLEATLSANNASKFNALLKENSRL